MGKQRKKKGRNVAPSSVEDLIKLSKKRAQQFAFHLEKQKQKAIAAKNTEDSSSDSESVESTEQTEQVSSEGSESSIEQISSNHETESSNLTSQRNLEALLQQVKKRKASAGVAVDDNKNEHTEQLGGPHSDGGNISAVDEVETIKAHSLFKAFSQLQPKKAATVLVSTVKAGVSHTVSSVEKRENHADSQSAKRLRTDENVENEEAQHQTQRVGRSDFSADVKDPKSTVALSTDATEWKLHTGITEYLEQQGIKYLFPIQRQAIPAIIATDASTGGSGNDVCINAPTGSGKTFVYSIPVVQLLCTRKLVCLRALVIVPSRELANQVHQVLRGLCTATGLHVDLATGQTSLVEDQSRILRHRRGQSESTRKSAIDILVATPGRLMDHLKLTPGFSLQDLEYLVVDEADRLLSQSYHDWLDKVYSAVYQGEVGAATSATGAGESSKLLQGKTISKVDGSTVPQLALRSHRIQSGISVKSIGAMHPPLRKILCSATLTRNPQKLAVLALRNPIQFSTTAQPKADGLSKAMESTNGDAKYTLPEGLKERMVLCSHTNKPLLLVRLLLDLSANKQDRTLVFTSSLKATGRLANLLQQFPQLSDRVAQLSSNQSQSQRSKVLHMFKSGKCSIIVASDVVARGIDIKGLTNVVSYDPPVYIKTYVHRVGRTARAGTSGNSYTLVRRDQARHFRQLFKKTGNVLETASLDKQSVAALKEQFDSCLQQMKNSMDETNA